MRTVPVRSPKEAELTKLLENTFRHVNIALVNELAMFARDLGIDVWEAIDAAESKPFGFMPFRPGPGVGGHCLPIDPSYLSWRVKQSLGQTFRFVELANDVNEHMPDYVIRRLVAALNDRELSVKGRRILVLGLAYKKNTGDDRESPERPGHRAARAAPGRRRRVRSARRPGSQPRGRVGRARRPDRRGGPRTPTPCSCSSTTTPSIWTWSPPRRRTSSTPAGATSGEPSGASSTL